MTVMHKMYRAFCSDKKEEPLSESRYLQLFLFEFNTGFFGCDLCEERCAAVKVNKTKLLIERMVKVLGHKKLCANCSEEREKG